MNLTYPTLSADEAVDRVRADHDVLLAEMTGKSAAELRAPYQVNAGPLGDFCESLHDLAAHILMWDEISLAVLDEAAVGRVHWSLDPRWETAEAGSLLNKSGVAAGRELPAELLLHRLEAARDAQISALTTAGESWSTPGDGEALAAGVGGLAEYAMTVPDVPSYYHAALHLDRVPVTTDAG